MVVSNVMAEITSLGIHTPTALPYLIAEGVLPQEPAEDQYTWETYEDGGDEVYGEEEVLWTRNCVVWSQGGVVRKVFRFELEKQDVLQALLTSFNLDSMPSSRASEADHQCRHDRKISRTQDVAHPELATGWASDSTAYAGLPNLDDNQNSHESGALHNKRSSLERALVVFLKTQAHIYFLSGASHIVSLPFEIERTIAAPCGLIVQRKLAAHGAVLATRKISAVPQNSSLYSHFGGSPASQRVVPDRSYRKSSLSRLNVSTALEDMYQDLLRSTAPSNSDALPRLFSFTDPCAEMTPIIVDPSLPRLSSSRSARYPTLQKFDTIDKMEELLYVSKANELPTAVASKDQPLILMVTANYETGLYTVWYASYISEKPASYYLKHAKSSAEALKQKWRGSQGPGPGTGTSTPAPRHRDGVRESFGGRARGMTESTIADTSKLVSGEQQSAENFFASQIDPEFEIPKQSSRDPRRVSSLLARAEFSSHNERSSYADLATGRTSVGGSFGATGRRGKSFGGQSDIGSFGASFGSLNNAGAGSRTPLRAVSSGGMFDRTDVASRLLRPPEVIVDHHRFELLSLQEPIQSFRGDLFCTRIGSAPMSRYPDRSPPTAWRSVFGRALAVQVLVQQHMSHKHNTEVACLQVCITDREAGDMLTLSVDVKRSHVTSKASEGNHPRTQHIVIPSTLQWQRFSDVGDSAILSDGGMRISVTLSAAEKLWLGFGGRQVETPLETQSLRLSDPFSLKETLPTARRHTGVKKTLASRPKGLRGLQYPGPCGTIDVVSDAGDRHRIQVKIRPSSDYILRILEVCQHVIGVDDGKGLIAMWLRMHSDLQDLQDLQCIGCPNREWTALVVLLFLTVLQYTESSAAQSADPDQQHYGSKLPALSPGEGPAGSEAMREAEAEAEAFGNSAWSWLKEEPRSLSYKTTNVTSTNFPTTTWASSDTRTFLVRCSARARNILKRGHWASASFDVNDLFSSSHPVTRLLLALHLFREEHKLHTLSPGCNSMDLAPVLAQIGHWIGWRSWDWSSGNYYDIEGAGAEKWVYDDSTTLVGMFTETIKPPSIYAWIEAALCSEISGPFVSLYDIMLDRSSPDPSAVARIQALLTKTTPRTLAICNYLTQTNGGRCAATESVEIMARNHMDSRFLDTLPEAVAAPLREVIMRCQEDPPTMWDPSLLKLVGREDLNLLSEKGTVARLGSHLTSVTVSPPLHDIRSICHGVETSDELPRAPEAERYAITRLRFKDDQRYAEAARILRPLGTQIAECPPLPDWSEAEHLEYQKRVMQWVIIRTIALAPGQSMLNYESRRPLLTEKFPLTGFSTSCIMKPMDNTVSADRSHFTEEKFCWAFFNAGVSAGLSISRHAEGIDTSWILFNKPAEPRNRHAGLLLALGLNGHLRSIAKWVAFKYLTPKHTMTSIGLLLGMSASYLGTMDTLVTRLLSVHVTRLLPPGAAELNLTPSTQTAGLMGIGLLYYNTQHRRMSEVMLSEIEHVDIDASFESVDTLRDESYRLAAGFALGFINLGKGKDLRGLHDMRLVERLLSVAIRPKAVNVVHILEQATAGAIIAIALIFLKTNDEALARKIATPLFLPEFDHIRPDMCLLRSLAKSLICWDSIRADQDWIQEHTPQPYKFGTSLLSEKTLRSKDLPLYNILTGMLWAIGLRYAGTGDTDVRDFLLAYLESLDNRVNFRTDYFDAKLTLNTVRRCLDMTALACAVVMAGTGDLDVLRWLRKLHGRVHPSVPYGSHLAAHLALGLLFLGGGCYTVSTSNLAIASLVCAFYPIWPTDVLDNKAHLQAFRHLWVFAAEPRCLVVRDLDTHRALTLPVHIVLTTGATHAMTAPCLLPDLATIATISITSPDHWPVTLDFAHNAAHRAAFRAHQTLAVRRRPAAASPFSAALAALNTAQSHPTRGQLWDWLFQLPLFAALDAADRALVVPPDLHGALPPDRSATAVDSRLVLASYADSTKADELRNLRLLFAWAERARTRGSGARLRWIGREVVEALRARIAERARRMERGGVSWG
ncbi:negative regulator of mitosis [Cryomyces antarcticus]